MIAAQRTCRAGRADGLSKAIPGGTWLPCRCVPRSSLLGAGARVSARPRLRVGRVND